MDNRTGEIVEFPDGKNPDMEHYRALPVGHIETIHGWPCKLVSVSIEAQELVLKPLTNLEKVDYDKKVFQDKFNKLRNR